LEVLRHALPTSDLWFQRVSVSDFSVLEVTRHFRIVTSNAGSLR